MVYVIIEWSVFDNSSLVQDNERTTIFDTRKEATDYAEQFVAFNYKVTEINNFIPVKHITIEKYKKHWAVYDGDELICLAVYKKGAEEIKRRLENA